MICHNASSNLRLRSGVAPLNHWAARGVNVAIGLDEAGINDDRDMLQEMRLGPAACTACPAWTTGCRPALR
jgi:cytosine/adenosine deaminase-related metal-dependent hydrolase